MNEILNLLETHGPLTGKELHEKTKTNLFDLWAYCNRSPDIIIKPVGTRYLRLDKYVEGYARLSPSILREFTNYNVIGLKEHRAEAQKKAELLHQSIVNISKAKYELAKDTMEDIIKSLQNSQTIKANACFIIAGDVAYEMAHLEPRPEFSTGRMVNGSDLDIVIVYKGLPEETVNLLDSAVYERKFHLLSNPSYKEELDYIIKDTTKVEKQLDFEGFESMVASKILDEGRFLCGSYALFAEIKKLVAERGIPEKLSQLKERAEIESKNAREKLLASKNRINDKHLRQLFYTTDEREEFF